METKVINPYSFMGAKQKDALDIIIANLPADPTIDQFNEVLLNAFFGADPNNPMNSEFTRLFLFSVLPLAYNGYKNGTLSQPEIPTEYTDNQLVFILNLIQEIKQVPAEAMAEFFDLQDEKIATGNFTYQQQLPLYAATVAGKSAAEYWTAAMENPGGWVTYLNANEMLNYLHIPGWVNASVQGALLSYNIIKPEQAVVPAIFPALVSAIGLTAGKVVYGWVTF